MTKIQKSGNQYRITIPIEIMDLTGWTRGDELIFVPYMTEPDRALSPDTPILLKRIEKVKKDKKESNISVNNSSEKR